MRARPTRIAWVYAATAALRPWEFRYADVNTAGGGGARDDQRSTVRSHQPRHPLGVPHRESLPVVVEVDVHVAPPRPPAEASRPLAQLGLGVVPAPSARAVV